MTGFGEQISVGIDRMEGHDGAIATIQVKPCHGQEAIPKARAAYRGAALPSDSSRPRRWLSGARTQRRQAG